MRTAYAPGPNPFRGTHMGTLARTWKIQGPAALGFSSRTNFLFRRERCRESRVALRQPLRRLMTAKASVAVNRCAPPASPADLLRLVIPTRLATDRRRELPVSLRGLPLPRFLLASVC